MMASLNLRRRRALSAYPFLNVGLINVNRDPDRAGFRRALGRMVNGRTMKRQLVMRNERVRGRTGGAGARQREGAEPERRLNEQVGDGEKDREI